MSRKPPPPPLRSAKRLTAPPGAEERREHIRYELVAQVQLRKDGDLRLLDVDNISAGGLRVLFSTGDEPAVVATDRVSIFVDIGDDAEGKPIAIDAEAVVVRVDRGGPNRKAGLALKWISGDEHFASSLERLLARINDVAS